MKNKSRLLTASLLAFQFLVAAGSAQANTLVIGNNFGRPGPIETFDFDAGGTRLGTFVPDGNVSANTSGYGGRGIAVAGNDVFYTEITFAQVQVDGDTVTAYLTDSIRVAPLNGGAGGADIRTIANPASGNGIAALAFSGGILYAMTGYTFNNLSPDPIPAQLPLQVWKLNPVNGAVLGGPINILNTLGQPHNVFADGFTVLPNGDFLINTDDGSKMYEQISSVTGQPTGFSIVVPTAFSESTGVDTDGTHLFFSTLNVVGPNILDGRIVETDMNGNLVADVPELNGNHGIEDISLVQPVPEPGVLSLLGIGLASLFVLPRARRAHHG